VAAASGREPQPPRYSAVGNGVSGPGRRRPAPERRHLCRCCLGASCEEEAPEGRPNGVQAARSARRRTGRDQPPRGPLADRSERDAAAPAATAPKRQQRVRTVGIGDSTGFLAGRVPRSGCGEFGGRRVEIGSDALAGPVARPSRAATLTVPAYTIRGRTRDT